MLRSGIAETNCEKNGTERDLDAVSEEDSDDSNAIRTCGECDMVLLDYDEVVCMKCTDLLEIGLHCPCKEGAYFGFKLNRECKKCKEKICDSVYHEMGGNNHFCNDKCEKAV